MKTKVNVEKSITLTFEQIARLLNLPKDTTWRPYKFQNEYNELDVYGATFIWHEQEEKEL